ncbi:MAG TPA: hypothetical protein VGI54_09115 [Solirubrobacteraceae bacterium]
MPAVEHQETPPNQEPIMSERETEPITIRRAYPDDEPALHRLAALDSAEPLAGDVLLAEIEAEAVAALDLESGAVIADPFHRTAGIVALLRLRADRRTVALPARRHRIRRAWAPAR